MISCDVKKTKQKNTYCVYVYRHICLKWTLYKATDTIMDQWFPAWCHNPSYSCKINLWVLQDDGQDNNPNKHFCFLIK